MKRSEWAVSLVAGLAFALVLVLFAVQLFSFRSDVERWARRDLQTQVRLAAENLAEPLRTQDFRRITELSGRLAERNLLLTVYSREGGVFYRFSGNRADADIRASVVVGEHKIELEYPASVVFMPFRRAVVGFALAVLVGVLGMFVVFFALYRQRVRIAELARQERFRREFIADVSHEIKTPLTGIIGAADMLDGAGAADGMLPKLVAMIKKESKRLNALVQQILDLARLEREGDVLNAEDVDLAALAGEVSAKYGVRFESAGVDSEKGLVVRCDPQLVSQAVSNLVENAVRHSGSDDISVTLRGDVSGDGMAKIAVEDHGIGIPPEHAERIFERFHRVDPSRAAASGGAGLGLSIVRRIARLHGGEVSYSPAVPHGSRFTLSLRMVW